MNEKIFQDVFDMVQDTLPDDWVQMVFFAGYTDGSYSMKFYSKSNGGEYIDCFHMPKTDNANLIKLFMKIDRILSKARTMPDDTNKWSIFTMIVDSDGKMKTEFDYGDYSENLAAYESEWKKKYLQAK